MTFPSLIIVLFIFVLSGVVIMRPFLTDSVEKGRPARRKYDALLAERERLLSSIEDLDLDYDLEKISSREHTRRRDALLSQAADVIKKLDAIAQPGPTAKKPPARKVPGDDLEKMIAARRKEIREGKANFCPHCGKGIEEGDKYCSHCGESL